MTTAVMFVGVGLIFVAVLTALVALALSSKEESGVNRSMAVLEALTSAPKEMKQELDAPFTDRVLTPLLASAQGIGRRMTPADASDTDTDTGTDDTPTAPDAADADDAPETDTQAEDENDGRSRTHD